MTRRIAATAVLAITGFALSTPATAATAARSRTTVHIVCAVEGGNGRFFIAFNRTSGGRTTRPPVEGVAISASGKTARDGWRALPTPMGVWPGEVVTSLLSVGAAHGTVSKVSLTYAGVTSQSVPVGYAEDCSYAGLPV